MTGALAVAEDLDAVFPGQGELRDNKMTLGPHRQGVQATHLISGHCHLLKEGACVGEQADGMVKSVCD